MITTPPFKFYALLTDTTHGRKTPRYTIDRVAGFYEPMEMLVGRDGKVSMFLQEKRENQTKSSTPQMSLQAKDSLNFTGLKDYFVDGKLSGFAYGYPFDKKTYSSGKKQNPFYDYRKDGFLFIIHQDTTRQDIAEQVRPSCIELLVLNGASVLISAYCKQLAMGGYDEALEQMRKLATPYKVL